MFDAQKHQLQLQVVTPLGGRIIGTINQHNLVSPDFCHFQLQKQSLVKSIHTLLA